MTAEAICVHHYRLEPRTADGRLEGRCRKCGHERTFAAQVPTFYKRKRIDQERARAEGAARRRYIAFGLPTSPQGWDTWGGDYSQ